MIPIGELQVEVNALKRSKSSGCVLTSGRDVRYEGVAKLGCVFICNLCDKTFVAIEQDGMLVHGDQDA